MVVAVTSRAHVEQMVNLIGCCGLEPVSIDLAAHSLQRWVHFSDDGSLPRLVTLHVSGEGVEVNLFHHGVLQGGIYLSLKMDSFAGEGPIPAWIRFPRYYQTRILSPLMVMRSSTHWERRVRIG